MRSSRPLAWLPVMALLLVLVVACGQAAPAPQPTPAPAAPAAQPTQPPAAPAAATPAPAAPAATPATTAPAAATPAAAAPAAQTGPIAKPGGYPSRPVQFIVPFNAGGGADVSQRVYNKYAEPIVGQQLPIVNRPGAGGVTGWTEMVRANPDGYTMGIITPPFNLIPAIVNPSQTGYTIDQFSYIAIYAIVPDALYVRQDSQFRTFQDLVDYAKQNPGRLKAANTGTLGADHLVTLMIEHAAGIQFTQVPFTGGAESLQATLAGTTEVMVSSSTYIKSHAGQVRPLAITTEQRDTLFPDVPTFKEQGYDVVSERYRVLGGPPGLPADIVNYWAQVTERLAADPAFRAEMDQQGQPATYLGPQEARARILDRLARDIESIVDTYNLRQK
jgi:putative tricarboxylic transport membrane protein